MASGGKRKGAGRKKGSLTPVARALRLKVLDREAAREVVRGKVCEALLPMLEAQIDHAKGLKYLVTREKRTGKFVKVSEAIARAANETWDEEKLETIEVWEKDPSVQAFADLLNRALGKPAEQVEMAVTGQVDIIAILNRRFERNRLVTDERNRLLTDGKEIR